MNRRDFLTGTVAAAAVAALPVAAAYTEISGDNPFLRVNFSQVAPEGWAVESFQVVGHRVVEVTFVKL